MTDGKILQVLGAVGLEDGVGRLERGVDADRDRLLPDVEVEETSDLALHVGAGGFLFHADFDEGCHLHPIRATGSAPSRGG